MGSAKLPILLEFISVFRWGFSVRSRHCADREAMCARAWCGAATGFRFSALLANESYYFRGGHAREISATIPKAHRVLS
jgi:hypothetical protein